MRERFYTHKHKVIFMGGAKAAHIYFSIYNVVTNVIYIYNYKINFINLLTNKDLYDIM